MLRELSELHQIFSRSIERVRTLMAMLSPEIANARDQHERLYFHHIYEEEEQRLGRLQQLVPNLSHLLQQERTIDAASFEFICILQDLNLEKFGLHNFLEHLDLALYHFTNEERSGTLKSMLEQTKADYLQVKDGLAKLNQQFLPAAEISLTQDSDGHEVVSAAHDLPVVVSAAVESLQIAEQHRKGLSVGSLKGLR